MISWLSWGLLKIVVDFLGEIIHFLEKRLATWKMFHFWGFLKQTQGVLAFPYPQTILTHNYFHRRIWIEITIGSYWCFSFMCWYWTRMYVDKTHMGFLCSVCFALTHGISWPIVKYPMAQPYYELLLRDTHTCHTYFTAFSYSIELRWLVLIWFYIDPNDGFHNKLNVLWISFAKQ